MLDEIMQPKSVKLYSFEPVAHRIALTYKILGAGKNRKQYLMSFATEKELRTYCDKNGITLTEAI